MSVNINITDLLAPGNKEIDIAWCEEMREKYPYFLLPEILLLKLNKTAIEPENLSDLMIKVALGSPDRNALYEILEGEAVSLKSFYPNIQPTKKLDTYSTIDTFLDNYGTDNSAEMEVLNNLIFNPTPDYAEILVSKEGELDATEETPKSKNDELIFNFINKTHTPLDEEAEPKPKKDISPIFHEQDDSLLSESLAKIYIKQRKYAKALEILSSLQEQYPEKSLYLDDQIRFLKKLILAISKSDNK